MMSIRRAKNRCFEALDGLPPPLHDPADRAVVVGYRVAGRVERWRAGCEPAGKRFIEKQKRKLGFLKPKKGKKKGLI